MRRLPAMEENLSVLTKTVEPMNEVLPYLWLFRQRPPTTQKAEVFSSKEDELMQRVISEKLGDENGDRISSTICLTA